MKKIIVLLLLFTVFSCTAQQSVVAIAQDSLREKLDIKQLEKDMGQRRKESKEKGITIAYKSINLTKELPDGSKFHIWEGGNDKEYIKEETPPLPYFYTFYKKYNLQGNLTYKEILFGKYTPIGITQEYDANGKLTEVNEDLKFGKIKPLDVLNFLEEKGWVIQKTGDGRKTFSCRYIEEEGQWIYVIEVFGAVDTQKIPDFGFPLGYESIFYIMNGETGEVQELSHDEFFNSLKNENKED